MNKQTEQSIAKIIKWAGVAALSITFTNILKHITKKTKKCKTKTVGQLRSLPSIAKYQQYQAFPPHQDKEQDKKSWGDLILEQIQEPNGLLEELQLMSKIVCPFEKVNNLIVDLQFNKPYPHAIMAATPTTYPCPIVATKTKRRKEEPFLCPQSLVKPGQFVIQNCAFRANQTIQTEKKFMKAGARSTQYFNPSQVRADVVCLGKITPGINNVIRQLVVLLKEMYKVERVTGVRFSWRGYYINEMVDLTPEKVEGVHHKGGCFLGVAACQCDAKAIVDSLQKRGTNHLYMIGGNNTISCANDIYRQIKKRRLNIALCVCLKAINKDIAYFDNCFGFQSAAEQTQRFLDQGYALSSSNYNSVVLVKVPGRYSGFLAMDAARAARNVNICLVPQFKYDLYGEKGILQYVAHRVQAKGHCIIVYSQGASYSMTDIPPEKYFKMLLQKQTTGQNAFDLFFRSQIESTLKQKGLNPHSTFFFDCQDEVRTVPANSLDTKLCSQIALYSIQGLMCGYTNFVIGHFRNNLAMVPLIEMNINQRYCLRVEDSDWQRLLTTTNQPPFRNI